MKSDYRKLNCLLVSLIILFSLGIGLIWQHILTDNKGIVRADVATLKETTEESQPSNDICDLSYVYCDNSIEGIITKSALKYGVDPDLMIRIAFCESSLNPLAVGDNGNSHGLWQIHKRYNKPELHAIAFDPVASSDWAAQRIANGELWRWSCAKKLGYL